MNEPKYSLYLNTEFNHRISILFQQWSRFRFHYRYLHELISFHTTNAWARILIQFSVFTMDIFTNSIPSTWLMHEPWYFIVFKHWLCFRFRFRDWYFHEFFQSIVAEWRNMTQRSNIFHYERIPSNLRMLWFFKNRPHYLLESIAKIAHFYIWLFLWVTSTKKSQLYFCLIPW